MRSLHTGLVAPLLPLCPSVGRRVSLHVFTVITISVFTLSGLAASDAAVRQWDVFELELTGPSAGNPFLA